MPDFNVADVWDALRDQEPDRLAVVFRDRRLSRAQMSDRSDRFARALVASGLGCRRERSELQPWETGQDSLAIYLHNGNEYLEAIVGAFKARVAPFNVNYRYVPSELQYLFNDAGARAVIFHSAFAPTLAEVVQNLAVRPALFQVADDSQHPLVDGAVWYEDALSTATGALPERSADDLYILYTGGTTGRPKGVLWRQADAFPECFGGSRSADSLAQVVQFADSHSRALIGAPFMHGAGHWVALSCIHRGGTVYIQDTPERFDPAETLDLIEREQVTFLLLVGDAFARPLLDELDNRSTKPASLSVVMSGGAPLSVGLKREILGHLPQVMIIDGMGSSEVGGQLQHVSTSGTVSTGSFPLNEASAVLSADLTRVLEPGDPELGWLAKRGPRLALGYLGDRAKTAATYPVVDGDRFGVPGDRARLRKDNVVLLAGRDSVTINSGGEKIFAEEVEAAIKSHPGVYDCLVTSRPSERWGQEVVAIVRARSGHALTDADLHAAAGTTLARYKLPKKYIYVPHIQRSPAGKPDYPWAHTLATTP